MSFSIRTYTGFPEAAVVTGDIEDGFPGEIGETDPRVVPTITGDIEDGLPGEEGDPFVELRPMPGMPQAEYVQGGVYHFDREVEERLGSGKFFAAFRQKLAELVDQPFPGSQTEKSHWQSAPFGVLLYLPEPNRSAGVLLIGADSCKKLHQDLEEYASAAYWALPMPYYDAYLSFQRAARLAATERGIIVIS